MAKNTWWSEASRREPTWLWIEKWKGLSAHSLLLCFVSLLQCPLLWQPDATPLQHSKTEEKHYLKPGCKLYWGWVGGNGTNLKSYQFSSVFASFTEVFQMPPAFLMTKRFAEGRQHCGPVSISQIAGGRGARCQHIPTAPSRQPPTSTSYSTALRPGSVRRHPPVSPTRPPLPVFVPALPIISHLKHLKQFTETQLYLIYCAFETKKKLFHGKITVNQVFHPIQFICLFSCSSLVTPPTTEGKYWTQHLPGSSFPPRTYRWCVSYTWTFSFVPFIPFQTSNIC